MSNTHHIKSLPDLHHKDWKWTSAFNFNMFNIHKELFKLKTLPTRRKFWKYSCSGWLYEKLVHICLFLPQDCRGYLDFTDIRYFSLILHFLLWMRLNNTQELLRTITKSIFDKTYKAHINDRGNNRRQKKADWKCRLLQLINYDTWSQKEDRQWYYRTCNSVQPHVKKDFCPQTHTEGEREGGDWELTAHETVRREWHRTGYTNSRAIIWIRQKREEWYGTEDKHIIKHNQKELTNMEST